MFHTLSFCKDSAIPIVPPPAKVHKNLNKDNWYTFHRWWNSCRQLFH